MSDPNQLPISWESVKLWVYKNFGLKGLIFLSLAGIAFCIYKNWGTIKKWPGVSPIIKILTRWPIPKADPNRFSVMISNLENDEKHEFRRLIADGLNEFQGIQVLVLDRFIKLEGPIPEKQEQQGQAKAQKYLKKYGASALIWGAVLSQGGQKIPKLYWTVSRYNKLMSKRYDSPRAEDQFRLPQIFWNDLADILKLLVINYSTQFEAKEGHFVADQISPFIDRVQTLLTAGKGRIEWSVDNWNNTSLILADALYMLGEQSGKNEPIKESVIYYQEILKTWTQNKAPLDWAVTQNKLGNALQTIGERENNTEFLEQAVQAYRDALKERIRDKVPFDWAMTQNNLGAALSILGERESDTKNLEQAVQACCEALKEYTQEKFPLDWAMTQNNLGAALIRLGERENNTEFLEQAIRAYREALKEWTRGKFPLQWAMTQNSLGAALLRLGERENNTEFLEQAVQACHEALKEYTLKKVPFQWAETQNNLGTVLGAIGERASDTKSLEEAFQVFKAALDVFEFAKATYYIENTKSNLQKTLALLKKMKKGTK